MKRASILSVALLFAVIATPGSTSRASARVGSLIADPWPPMGAVVERAIHEGWVCAGLPHPAVSDGAVSRHWSDPGGRDGRVIGLVARMDEMVMLLWPMPFL